MAEGYQEVFAQQVREMAERREAGLPLASWVRAEELAPETANSIDSSTGKG